MIRFANTPEEWKENERKTGQAGHNLLRSHDMMIRKVQTTHQNPTAAHDLAEHIEEKSETIEQANRSQEEKTQC